MKRKQADALCKKFGCNGLGHSRGLCKPCYQAAWRNGEIEKRKMQHEVQCTSDGCDRKSWSRNLCRRHYGQRYHAENYDRDIAKNALYREKYYNKDRAFDRYIKNTYGWDLAKYNEVLASQGGVCAICSSPPLAYKRHHIDHCHTTGKVRGILCNNCNTALGGFRDSPDNLRRAALYLERNKG
jgi:hypothetical protein